MRLLVVEDDDIVADAILRSLAGARFAAHRVKSAEAAREALAAEQFALAVIDVGLPGADGLTFVRRLRTAGAALPTLVLTARCTLNDKVAALDLGADDFLAKPFEPAELVARCRALLRRSGGTLDGVIRLHRLRADLAGKRLWVDEAEVTLTAREWALLDCLLRRVGQVVPKERVQQALAQPDQELTPNAVEAHVSRLRAKLGDAVAIRSLRGLGYRLDEAKSA